MCKLVGVSSLGRRDGKIHIPHYPPFRLAISALATQKGDIPTHTGQGYPLQKAQKGGYPAAFLCVVVFGQTLYLG